MAFADNIKSDSHEQDTLKAVFQNVYPTWAGGTPSMSTVSGLNVSLHTADPGATGVGTENEVNSASYIDYARATLTRNTTNFSVTAGVATSLVAYVWPDDISSAPSPLNVTHAVVWVGASEPHYRLELQSTLVLDAGVTPTIGIGKLSVTET